MPRRNPVVQETLEERWLLEAQTARNLEGLAAEQAGDIDGAIALYERNAAEGFPGDLPYGRLVALYERRQQLDQAERVLRRAIEVFESSTRRTPRDRRATIRVFKNRLKALGRGSGIGDRGSEAGDGRPGSSARRGRALPASEREDGP